jgi:negative regulator of flagellin synthesis FlgM
MIISGKQIQSIMKIYTEQNKVAKSAKTAEVAPASKKDEVILSTQAQEFGQIYQAIKAMPEVREDKVRELSERIAQGNYSVDAKEVAEKMLGRLLADRER